MSYIKRFIIVGLCLSLFTLISTAQEDLEEQTLLLTFIPNIQFAPVYVGLELGLYEDAGYDLDVQYIEEPQVADLVGANINQFGVVSGEQLMQAVEQDRPIVYVYEWFQQFPIGIVYSSDMAVESVEDLVDARIGIPGPFGSTYTGFIALLNSVGLDITDIQTDSIGFSAPDVFCIGGVDASVVYTNNEPIQIINRAESGTCGDVSEVSIIEIGEQIDLVSNGIITNQETIENNPELVETFISVWDETVRLTINNPARAYLLSASYIEGLPLTQGLEGVLFDLAEATDTFLAEDPTREAITANREAQFATLAEQFNGETLLQFEVLLATIEFWDAEQLGYSDSDAWANMQDALLSLELLQEARDVETYFTNDFVPARDE